MDKRWSLFYQNFLFQGFLKNVKFSRARRVKFQPTGIGLISSNVFVWLLFYHSGRTCLIWLKYQCVINWLICNLLILKVYHSMDLKNVDWLIDCSRRLTSLTLSKHTTLLEILELPQLMDTVVRNQHYDEALGNHRFFQGIARIKACQFP